MLPSFPSIYPVPHTSSAPSEFAVPPMHPTLDRESDYLSWLPQSVLTSCFRSEGFSQQPSSYPPSSLSHNSDPMLSCTSLGLGLGMHTASLDMHTASLGTHTASVPYIPTSVSSSTSVSYPASTLYSSSLVFTPDHNQNAFTTPLQGPSLSQQISGLVFPLAPSLGLNGIFLSSNPLENVLVGDIYCLHAHLATHRLSPQGLSTFAARQVLVFHLLFGMSASSLPNGESAQSHSGCKTVASSFTSVHHMSYTACSVILSSSQLSDTQVKVLSSALGIASPSTMSELFRVLSEKRVALLHSQSYPIRCILYLIGLSFCPSLP
jgi:hypothetical protein